MKYLLVALIAFLVFVPARSAFADANGCVFGTFYHETGSDQPQWVCPAGKSPASNPGGAPVFNEPAGTTEVPPTTPAPAAAPSGGSSGGSSASYLSSFIPLAPIPGVNPDQYTGDIAGYLNKVFGFAITVAAVLAVVFIIIEGIRYMTSEAIPDHVEALKRIRAVVGGVILLLISWLILYVISPQILDLNALKSDLVDTSFTGATNANPTQVTYTPGQLPPPTLSPTLTTPPVVNWSTAP